MPIHSLSRSLLVAALGVAVAAPLSAQSIAARYAGPAARIIARAEADSSAWDRLATLTDTYGPRLSGSAALESAIDWILATMKQDGLDAVRSEPVMVPHWVRGSESLQLTSPREASLKLLGLGMSVGTPPEGIEAPLLVVRSFDELQQRAPEVEGKIVLFNAAFTNYGETVEYRAVGASRAAALGARAMLVRSVASQSLATPHTGTLVYDSTAPRIPAAAITIEDAAMLQRMQDRGNTVRVKLVMGAQTLPDAPSRNVIAEVRGGEKPDEIIVMGGHIDSWDVGQGAMDDGGGCVAAWEALRLLRQLALRPKRTVRVVCWTNEENGGRGAAAYFSGQGDAVQRHVLAIESDNGAFTPQGFAFTGSDAAMATIREIAGLLKPIHADSATAGGGGADIGPLMRAGVPGMSPLVENSRYFWYHHSDADTMDKLDPRDMQHLSAALAVMAYVVADLPAPLPRASQ